MNREARIRRARELRRNSTEAERVLWSKLRGRQVNDARFPRQHPAGGYIVDFLCVDAKLVIEVDGGQHDEYAEVDRERDARLSRAGYRVLRFWNNEVLGNTDGVLLVIAAALRCGQSGEGDGPTG